MSNINKNLRQDFEKAVDAYVDALLYMWSDYDNDDPSFTPIYGYWVGDDKSGVYCYGDDTFINLSDIILCVEKDVSYNDYMEWVDYCTQAREFGFDEPNLRSWLNGCPRVPQETFDKLQNMKENLESFVEVVKHNPNILI
jgi:hypothetical protein